LPSLNCIKPSFNAALVAAAESAAGAGVVDAAESVDVVDDLELSLLHPNVKAAIAAINKIFFMMRVFKF